MKLNPEQRDVLNRLALLDADLMELGVQDKLSFVIFGGAAFLLQSPRFRATFDIDVVLLKPSDSGEPLLAQAEMKQRELMDKYDINNAMQSVSLLPEGFQNRMKRINMQFENLAVYLPDPMDLVINKLLGRADDRDIADVTDSGILDKVDLNELRKHYAENLKDTIGNPVRYPVIEDVISTYLENREKQWLKTQKRDTINNNKIER